MVEALKIDIIHTVSFKYFGGIDFLNIHFPNFRLQGLAR